MAEGGGATAVQGQAKVAENVPWEAAARGPLLVTILRGYTAVSPPAWRQELTCVAKSPSLPPARARPLLTSALHDLTKQALYPFRARIHV